MEESGRVDDEGFFYFLFFIHYSRAGYTYGEDDEGRPILERVDLMETFFTVRSKSCI